MIFVFGSNLAGIHGAGAARFAKLQHGAIWGQGVGLRGNSFAIPTKDEHIRTLPLNKIARYVEAFLLHAACDPHNTYQVTCIGCGLAGYKDEQIAPMFKSAWENCLFDEKWRPILGSEGYLYWGTL